MSKLPIVLAALLPTLALAGMPEDGQKRTQAFIDALMTVKSVETGTLPKADVDANQKIFATLDGFFDWDYLMTEPVKPRADKFSAAEKTEFTTKFKEVLRLVAYPDSGSFFKKAKYKVNPGKEDGADKVIVAVEAKKGDIETAINIHYKLMGGALKIYDVSFDGDSLVKDYQNQMVRIIDKGGAKDLIAKIDKRKADLEKPKK